MFGSHPLSWVYNHGGVFPVRRGFHDEEAFITAFEILNRGGAIGMYVEGGRSRTGEVGNDAKTGIGRLAIESGAPVVPVAILGSHQVRNWMRLRFPKVIVRYGRPVRFERHQQSTREQQQRAADEILGRIREMHGELAWAGSHNAARLARERAAYDRATTDRAAAEHASNQTGDRTAAAIQ
jgi:1-acyl-sn-glycerol-3-phosphate acyltransferase